MYLQQFTSISTVLDAFCIFIFKMMEEKETTVEKKIVTLEDQEKNFNELLNTIGLQTPLDYIFLDFAQQKSRLSLKEISDTPHFLFHTVSQHELKNAERPFPHCLFIEKKTFKKFDEEVQSSIDVTEGILWNLTPSDIWTTRNILPFTDFHLYFMDVIKPLYGYSAEDLYRTLDQKKQDVFFITHGTRNSSESKRIITLFCTEKHIVAFHIDDVDVAVVPISEKFMSKWISADLPLSLHSVHEFAIFERPSFQLVPEESNEEKSEEQKIQKTVNFSTPSLDTIDSEDDCMNCSS